MANAIGGFGMLLNLDALQGAVTVVASCPHQERLGQAYCPVCGTRVRDREERDETDLDAFSDFFHALNLPEGWVRNWSEYTGGFIGWGFEVSFGLTQTAALADIPPPEDVLANLNALLAEWPQVLAPDTFGFHVLSSER